MKQLLIKGSQGVTDSPKARLPYPRGAFSPQCRSGPAIKPHAFSPLGRDGVSGERVAAGRCSVHAALWRSGVASLLTGVTAEGACGEGLWGSSALAWE